MQGKVFRTGPKASAPVRPVRKQVAIGAGIFGLYLIGGAIAYWRLWPHLATYQDQGGTGDPAAMDWYLAWDRWSVLHLHNPFVTRVVNYPAGANMVGNTAMLLLGILMIPVTSLCGPVASFNILSFLSLPLSGAGGYVLARRFTTWRPAAFCAGLLYGFCPYLVAHDAFHLNLTFVPLPPLIMLVLYDLVIEWRDFRLRRGTLLGVMLAAQFLISSEVFTATVLFTLLALIVIVIWTRGRRALQPLVQAWRPLAVAAAVVAVILAWPVYELLFGLQHINGAIDDWSTFHSSLAAPFLPTDQFMLGTAHLKQLGAQATPSGGADGPYLGVPLIATLVLAAVFIRRRVARVLGVLVVIVFVLSLGDRFSVGLHRFARLGHNVPMPGALLHDTPLLKSAYPGRFSLFVALFASVLLALTIDVLRARFRAAVALAVAFVCLLPLVPSWPYTGIGPTRVPAYFTTAAVEAIPSGSVVLVYPFADQGGESYAELWQAESDFRFSMVEGSYLLPSAAGVTYFRASLTQSTLQTLMSGGTPAMTPALRSGLESELHSWGVGTVVVQPLPGASAFFQWLIGRAPDSQTGGMLLWYRVSWTPPTSS